MTHAPQAAGAAQRGTSEAEPRIDVPNDAGSASHAPAPRRSILPAVLLFSALSLLCGIFSDGFLTADALTHYLYAKHAFEEPHLLVDVWGRPLVTALYAGPAALGGRTGARAASLVVALVCAASAYKIAAGQKLRRPELAFLFTLAQPLVFLNSFAEMTELPFATVAGLAFWAYQSKRWWAAALLAGLTPLARPEGFELVALAAVGLLANRKLLPLLALPLPMLLWNHAGWELYGRPGPWWRWLGDNWPYATNSVYPAGHLLQFVFFLPAVVSPFILPATLLGIWQSLVRRGPGIDPPEADDGSARGWLAAPLAGRFSWFGRKRPASGAANHPRATDTAPEGRESSGTAVHRRVCQVMTALIPLSILGVHSLLYWTGKMASYGEPRYLLVAAPFWAVLSARGWEWAWDRTGWRRPLRWAGALSLLPALALLFHPVLPLRRPAHWAVAEQVAVEYRVRLAPEGYTKVMAAHPAVFYYLGVSPTDKTRVIDWTREAVENPPPGTVLVWDPIYGPRNAHTDRALTSDEIVAAGWVPMPELDQRLARTVDAAVATPTPDPAERIAVGGGWRVFVSAARGTVE